MIPGNNSTRSVGSISEGRNDLTPGRSVELSERSIDAEEQVPFLPGTSDPALPRSQSNMSSSRFMSIVVTLAKNGLVRQLLLLGFLFSVCWCMIFVFFLPVMDPVDRERLQYSNSFESAHEKVTFKRILLECNRIPTKPCKSFQNNLFYYFWRILTILNLARSQMFRASCLISNFF